MNLLIVCVSLSLICVVSSSSNLKTKMEEYGIVPEVINKVPIHKLEVSYKEVEVNLGNELTPLQVKDQPEIKWPSDENSFYTLLMVDPDAPSRKDQSLGQVRHWFVGNIKGSDVKTGDEISAYVGSGPPKGSGLHRYIFLLYKQEQGKINFDEPKTASNSRAHRLKFNTREFVQKYKLGDPIAANFYQAQWDEYVDIRNKNITN